MEHTKITGSQQALFTTGALNAQKLSNEPRMASKQAIYSSASNNLAVIRSNVSMNTPAEPKYTKGGVIVNHHYFSGLGLNFTEQRQEMNNVWEKSEKPIIKSKSMWNTGSTAGNRFIGNNFDKDLEKNWGFSMRVPNTSSGSRAGKPTMMLGNDVIFEVSGAPMTENIIENHF